MLRKNWAVNFYLSKLVSYLNLELKIILQEYYCLKSHSLAYVWEMPYNINVTTDSRIPSGQKPVFLSRTNLTLKHMYFTLYQLFIL